MEKIVERFPVKRVIAVADRGLLSTDNLADLQAIKLPGGGGALEFILAVPGRRYGEFVDLLGPMHAMRCMDAAQEVVGETVWTGLRLIVAHDPQVASQANLKRDARIDELHALAAQWVGKLDDQDNGKTSRGRKLSDGGARARFYHEVIESRLARIVRVDLKSQAFTYAINERALAHARLMDGKLLLLTNATDLTPKDVIQRYKSLADIERGLPGPEVGNRDRAGLSPTARSNPGTRDDLLHGIDPVPRDAVSPARERSRVLARACAVATAPNPASPSHPQRHATRCRNFLDRPRPSRHPFGAGHQKTHLRRSTNPLVVERLTRRAIRINHLAV